MREIKFRGKTKNGEWKFGSLLVFNENSFIATPEKGYGYVSFPRRINIKDAYRVIPESVGQFTELKDKNDADIYEGDILNLIFPSGSVVGGAEVYWDYLAWQVKGGGMLSNFQDVDLEIIGNIYENHEGREKV